jgi:hypothetical protein
MILQASSPFHRVTGEDRHCLAHRLETIQLGWMAQLKVWYYGGGNESGDKKGNRIGFSRYPTRLFYRARFRVLAASSSSFPIFIAKATLTSLNSFCSMSDRASSELQGRLQNET